LIKSANYEFHPEYWGNVSDEAKDLIRHLLVLDVNKRFTADQALNHSWIKRSSSELADRNLDSNLKTMKRFNARRKFRAAIRVIVATNRMRNLLGIAKGLPIVANQKGKTNKNPLKGGAAVTATVPIATAQLAEKLAKEDGGPRPVATATSPKNNKASGNRV